MFSLSSRAAVAFLVIGTGYAQADPLSFGAASGYNVFVFNNFSEYSTDAQGKMAVGGDFAPAGNGGFTIAASHGSDGAGIYDLVVGEPHQPQLQHGWRRYLRGRQHDLD